MALRPIRPMLASSAAELPEGRDWSYEVEWDGYRAIAIKDGTAVRLHSAQCGVQQSQHSVSA